MELTKDMFFNGDELDSQKVVTMINQHPNNGVEILDFIGEVMRDELEFKYEEKRLKEKYHHDLRELHEKYGHDLDE